MLLCVVGSSNLIGERVIFDDQELTSSVIAHTDCVLVLLSWPVRSHLLRPASTRVEVTLMKFVGACEYPS